MYMFWVLTVKYPPPLIFIVSCMLFMFLRDNFYVRHSADMKIRCGIVAGAIICCFRVSDLHVS
ncbi:hypothetical protein MTR67_051660 [Solanum verrucosum]|uniref:Uncharacterized protein n=1 Tax=Solanum verrucosum TaxID=315347 RepID=A0AAF0V5J3_SOLVR|nr:hypothetical protein MTR67_051660 [Solanum verrucosum]